MKAYATRFSRLCLLALILAGLTPGAAQAGVFGEVSLLPYIAKPELINTGSFNVANVGQADTSEFRYDVSLMAGYAFMDMFMLGGKFYYRHDSFSQDATAVNDATTRVITKPELGPMIGFKHGGFYATFTYVLSGNESEDDKVTTLTGTVKTDSTTVFKKSHIYHLNIGYSFQISPMVSIGPSLFYRTATYKAAAVTDHLAPTSPANGVDQTYAVKKVESELLPMASLVVKF